MESIARCSSGSIGAADPGPVLGSAPTSPGLLEHEPIPKTSVSAPEDVGCVTVEINGCTFTEVSRG